LEPFLRQLDAALARGLRMVMVREKKMRADALAVFAGEVVRRCHAAGAQALIHGDARLAAACGADGVHLSAPALLQASTRPSAGLCGASCHDAGELQQAQRLDLDYAVLGAVLPTASHPGQPALGWERFAELIADCTLPVYALGGMQPRHLERAWLAGAHGIAMMRAAWETA
ncbi:MAG TPA: thiamine phosphate synthase, partial [Burkholderiales bacterium]|nr:thiamine phosphate synthase [Burkholderiales bacterium]